MRRFYHVYKFEDNLNMQWDNTLKKSNWDCGNCYYQFLLFSYFHFIFQSIFRLTKVCVCNWYDTLKFDIEKQSKEDIYVKSSIRFCSLLSTKALSCSVIAASFFSLNYHQQQDSLHFHHISAECTQISFASIMHL